MKKIIIAFLLSLPIFVLAQDPASIKWKQLKTKEFRLIYPENYDSVAKRIGSMLLIGNKYETFNMKCKPRRISIVLHNQSSMSNGWVGIAPRNAEFFHTPMQTTLSPMDWNASLVLHEYRHVIQYEMLRQGFTGRFLYYAFGNIGWAIKSFTTPAWFYEGDAVATETALSKAGRGRSPDFSKGLRAQLLEKHKYSYAKATCGSYHDFIPNHYVLGYNLVAYGRYVWNAELWRKAHKRSATIFGFTPFSRGIKKETGYSKYGFYKLALNDLKIYWENQLKDQKLISYYPLKYPTKKTFTNYKYPCQLNDKTVMALKSGMGDIPTIVSLDGEGNETTIAEVASLTYGNPIQSNGKQIVWVEEFPNIRWTNKSYSDIMLYETTNKKAKRLTHKQHLYAPALSPDGSKLVAVEVTEKGIYRVVILDANTGKVIKRINTHENQYINTPHWANDNKTIACILLSKNGKSLSTLNSETNKFTMYSQPSSVDISEAFLYQKYIVFASEHNSINNEIYALDTVSKQYYQITNTRFGSQHPSVNSYNELLFATYTSNGNVLASIPFDDKQWTKYDFTTYKTDSLVLGLQKDEIGLANLFDTTQSFDFKAKPYRKLTHLLNPHSWGFLMDITGTNLSSSITSQNKLGTMYATGGYTKDNIGTKKGFATLMYTGFYPIIQLDFESGTQGELYETIEDFNITDTILKYKKTQFSQRISLPFNLSSHNYTTDLMLSITNQFLNTGNTTVDIYKRNDNKSTNILQESFTAQNSGYYDYIDLNVTFNNIKASPQKNLAPTFGQTFEIGYVKFIPILQNSNKTFFDYSSRFYCKGNMYLPGFIKHQGINISGGYTEVEKSNSKNPYFNQNPTDPLLNFARGYINYNAQNYKAFGAFSANYLFTIANPDVSLPAILYLKRLKGSVFYDISIANENNNTLMSGTRNFKSYGIEFITENHLLNIPTFAINFGIRLASIDPENGQIKRQLFGGFFIQLSN